METKINGKSWTVGNNVTVYEIIPEKRWTMDKIDGLAMSSWIFEDIEKDAVNNPGYFKSLGYSIVVAGTNFGCGSKSVEHPMAALKASGVKLVIADSFSRYSYRNAINLGLPVITGKGVTEFFKTDDEVEVNLVTGEAINLSTNKKINLDPLSDFAMDIIAAGGSLEYTKKILGR